MKTVVGISMAVLLGHWFVLAQPVNHELIEQFDEDKQVQTASLALQSFDSCADMEAVLTDFLQAHRDQLQYGHYPRMRMYDDVMVEESAVDMVDGDAGAVGSSPTSSNKQSNRDEFSSTNLQKSGVDEADIIKTDGRYIYYYSHAQNKVHILRSPYDMEAQTVDLASASLVSQIAVPDSFGNVNLYLHEDQLLLIGTRYSNQYEYDSYLERYARTALAIYAIDAGIPALSDYVEFDGSLLESRLHQSNGQLTLIGNIPVNWGYGYEAGTQDTADAPMDINVAADSLLPTMIAAHISDGDIDIAVEQASCDAISYLLPDSDQLEHFGGWPSFTSVATIDLDDLSSDIQVVFGYHDYVHMSTDRLYLASNHYVQHALPCPMDVACVLPVRESGAQTLIHGFLLGDDHDFAYQGTTMVPGSPLTQYSMDEHQGDFRIVTSTRDQQSTTHVSVIDEDMRVVGALADIAPGERFQSSRFMGDKLYLVTFEQIDPLFVVDLASETPRIIGELKMPGFSEYLHPLGAQVGGVQYLFGLGYNASTNQRGGTVTDGVQLTVYKVDYHQYETADSMCGSLAALDEEYQECLEQVDTDRIRVELTKQLVVGERASYTPVVRNPRMFVINSDYEVTLPLYLTNHEDKKKVCTVEYDTEGNVIDEVCETIREEVADFVGLKSYALTPSSDIAIREVFSKDYRGALEAHSDYGLYGYMLDNMGFRVGFAGDSYYVLNSYFADFVLDDEHVMVDFAE